MTIVASSTVRRSHDAPRMGSRLAREFALEIIESSPSSEPFDAAWILAEHPELRDHKSVVIELAFEEYERTVKQGRRVDPGQFASRFPGHEPVLLRMIEIHEQVEQDPKLLRRFEEWPEAGDDAGAFELIEELGTGEFSRVFLAVDHGVGGRAVVVKICAGDGPEAETMGRLAHENIVPVYSVDRDDTRRRTTICMPFLGRCTGFHLIQNVFSSGVGRTGGGVVCEALEAAGAADRPRHGQEDLATARRRLAGLSYADAILELAADAAGALSFVHRRDVFHGDIKPSNLLVTPAGKAMLFDFELAREQQRPDRYIGGTFPYMAPEQLRALQSDDKSAFVIDGRTDVFAFGAMLYELLTGELPFGDVKRDDSNLTAARRILDRQEKGLRLPPRLLQSADASLLRVVKKCLAISPAERYAGGVELAADIQHARRRRWRRTVRAHRGLIAALVLAASLLLCGAAAAIGYAGATRDARLETHARDAMQGGDSAGAVSSLLLLSEDRRTSAEIRLLLVKCHLELDNLDAAEAEIAAILARKGSQEPVDADIVRQLRAAAGYVFARKAAGGDSRYDFQLAIAHLRAGHDPRNPSAAVLCNLGYCYLESYAAGDLQVASEHLEESAALDPSLAAARMNLAVIEIRQAAKQQRLPRLDDGRAALALAPDSADAQRLMAELHAVSALNAGGDEQGRMLQEALRYAREALKRGVPKNDLSGVKNACDRAGCPGEFSKLQEQPTAGQRPNERLVNPLGVVGDRR